MTSDYSIEAESNGLECFGGLRMEEVKRESPESVCSAGIPI